METRLYITVDTEEDAWGQYDPYDNPTENLKQLPRLQAIFDRYDAVPTYLIDYPVAVDSSGLKTILDTRDAGRCEIGAHCHPWNTPPYEERRSSGSTMLCNLPAELQYRKLETLHTAIARATSAEPASFRAGRWAFSMETARCLYRLGYAIDTSLTPFVTWTRSRGPDHSASPTKPHHIHLGRACGGTAPGALLEIPVTVGYLQKNWMFCRLLRKKLSHPIGRRLRLLGGLHRLGWLNLAWLSPELSGLRVMIRLAQTSIARGNRHLNFTFHSNALIPGKGPFVSSRQELERFYFRIDGFLAWAAAAGIQFAPLNQAARISGAVRSR